jgi:hypothetical protein
LKLLWTRAAFYFAQSYAHLGQKDRAFFWLEKAYSEHDHELLTLKLDPELDGLRADPRFEQLVRRVGLPQ